jgi:hypothetical protein
MTPQAEFGPDVYIPTDDDHDPDRVTRDAVRNAQIAKAASEATLISREFDGHGLWHVTAIVGTHKHIFNDASLTEALLRFANCKE